MAPGWDAVRDVLADLLARGDDVGAACAVWHDGAPVVDVWGGLADPATGRPWTADTSTIVFSATKGVTAICVLRLVERSLLALDQPVATWWPEFAANGKADITLRDVLSHRAGLAAVDGTLTLPEVLAWDPVVAAIAAQAPSWEPGSAHGYHARAFGWILGELVRRVTGRSLGRYLADEVTGPLGAQFTVGTPAEALARFAPIIPPTTMLPLEALLGADSLTVRVMSGPSGLFAYDTMWNRPDVLAAEMPSSNGVGTARALARVYAAVVGDVDGIRLLRPDTVDAARAVQAEGPDRVLLLPTCFGLGFMLQPALAPGAGAGALGHPGAGGALAFADPEARLAFAYVPTRMVFDPAGDVRSRRLVEAAYGCIS